MKKKATIHFERLKENELILWCQAIETNDRLENEKQTNKH